MWRPAVHPFDCLALHGRLFGNDTHGYVGRATVGFTFARSLIERNAVLKNGKVTLGVRADIQNRVLQFNSQGLCSGMNSSSPVRAEMMDVPSLPLWIVISG